LLTKESIMSVNPPVVELSTGADYEALAARFRPIFARIAEGELERERSRSLPYEPIRWLKEAGFGAVRVPVAHGGAGASLPQLFRLLIELAEADANLPQALRGHFAFVEDRLNAAPSPERDRWLARFVAGELESESFSDIAKAMGAEGIVVDNIEDVGPALQKAIAMQMNEGKTCVIEIMCTRELGDPFRRDALAKPVRLLEKYKDYV